MNRPTRLNGITIPYNTPVPDLVRAASKPGPEAWAAVVALGHDESGEAYDVLLRLAASPDWCYRRAALEAIAVHVRSHDAHTLFCAALKDESPYVVRTACEITGSHRITQAHSRVCGLLSSSDQRTREVAVGAITKLWTDDDFDRLLKLFRDDASLVVQRKAAWALRENVCRRTWRELVEWWKKDALPRHRTWACEIAGDFGDTSVKEDLEVLAKDRDGHVRKAANRALEKVETRSITMP